MTGFQLPAAWPDPADADAAARLTERFQDLGAPERKLAGTPAFATLLACLGGNSPYLSDLALREHAALRQLAKTGPDSIVQAELAALHKVSPTATRASVTAALRRAKRVIALATAIADLGDMWKLEQITAALTDLADAALRLSVAHLLRAAHDAGEIKLPRPADPSHGCGFTVLAMGKLGARELNYSSDVDLVLLHDPESDVYHGDGVGAFYTRIARNLVGLMEARDADGYVFRTDLRLRPDPAATPPSVALPAAISYYESMGQNWERAAMLKARPVAGDLNLGAEFLEAIRPFVWRRHLDFAAIADIHAMKQRIDAHRGHAATDEIAGLNVKLGIGGIREVEFLCQTLQLVWGGRDPGLRIPRTLEALKLLVKAGHLPAGIAAEMAAAYRFLRAVEHRLQMVADRQTHSLPQTPEALDAFSIFMGFRDARGFATVLRRHLGRVQAGYSELFAAVPESLEQASPLDFSGVGPATEATAAALKAMGFMEIQTIVAAVRSWQVGRIRALRSMRARELMHVMLPRLLAALARHGQPDMVFAKFDLFLAQLPAGVQLLSLFERQPALLDRLAAILGAAPSLADHLARTPSTLEGLLNQDDHEDFARAMKAPLADARGLEEAIAVIRRVARERTFSISVATLEGRLDADAAGIARSKLADATLAALLPEVMADFQARYGRVRGGGMAVVLLGKAGSREMMAGSDLDLMLVYDHPEDVSASTGPRPMPTSQYFIRAVHAFMAALTAPDAEGAMYEVDMRLRPSGNKGPVAVSLRSFEHYHAHDAWTWERMALTRARVVAGPASLRKHIEAAIRVAIGSGDPAAVRGDALAMRRRMLKDLPASGPWDVKLRVGGQVEVDFVTQVQQLLNARAHPELASPTTRMALERLLKAGLLPEEDAAILIQADRVWRTVLGMLRILYGRTPLPALSDTAAAALLPAVQRAGWAIEAVDLAGLHASLDRLAAEVRAVFVRQLGEIET